jgi:ABC-type antimicrobial peptide transport system permease subunit
MQTRLLSGRDFTDYDSDPSQPVVIVNQIMARKFWPDQEPLGKRIRLGVTTGPYATVVGVAQDGKYLTLGEGSQPYMFLPALQAFPEQASIVVRTKIDPSDLIGPIREQIRTLDPTLPVLGVQTIDQFRNRLLGISDVLAGLLAGFAILALILAGIGVYGVISVSVGQRAHEIGVRMAIGAHRADVIRMIIKQSGSVVLLGSLSGLAASLVFGHLMVSLLYGVNPADAFTVMVALGLVILIALIAAYVPARRAASADPLQAIRCE